MVGVGTFNYPMEIAARPEGPFVRLEPLVDTGALYSWVPASVLADLGLHAGDRGKFRLADGTVIERDLCEAVVRIDGRARHTIVVFGDEGTDALLGAYTMEGFGVMPDPVEKRLVPVATLPLLNAGPMNTSDQPPATSDRSVGDLATRHCAPCEGGTPPMRLGEAEALLAQVPSWRLVEGEPLKLARTLKREDFASAMAFVNRVADLAEAEGHHPDICVSWNRVTLELFTHAIGGLSDNDFIMAAKINELAADR